MKRIALIAIVGGFALASCKKDYTCTCTDTDSNGQVQSTSSTTITDHMSDAKAACNDKEGSFAGYTRSCDLK